MPAPLVDPIELEAEERPEPPAPAPARSSRQTATRRRRPPTGRRRGRVLSPPEPPAGREDGLAATLRRSLAESGLSLAEVAERAGTTTPALSRFFRGRRTMTLETAERVADVLGLALLPRRGARRGGSA